MSFNVTAKSRRSEYRLQAMIVFLVSLDKHIFSFNRADRLSAYNPPSASTHDSTEPATNMFHAGTRPLQSAHPSIPGKVNQLRGASSDLREQVKDALRSLQSHNI